MQYMLLIYGNEGAFNTLPKAEKATMEREMGQFVEKLSAEGILRGANPLQHVANATTVRFKDGKRVTMDGPVAEMKEQLGGYFLVDVADLDAALAVVARMPECSPHTAVEVRPVQDVAQANLRALSPS